MASTTSITPAEIAVALGRPAPLSGSVEEQQWWMWILDAQRIIQRRVTDLAIAEATIDATDLDYVVREAVATQVRDESTQAPLINDGSSVFKAMRSGPGRVTILGEWWELLGLAPNKGKAYSVDMMPPGAGLYNDRETYWWVTP